MVASCLAFLSGFGMVLLISLNTGLIADRKWSAVALQPLVTAMWVLGTTQVVKGFWPCVTYTVGATAGSALGLFLRKRKS
jgi:hypothetical protein